MTEVIAIPVVKKEKVFFPNLDALRFFSFLFVFFNHIFGTKNPDIQNESWYQFYKNRLFSDGDIGVSFFFVLSGFLITYLLLKEKQLTSHIDVRSFYIRRALRIWPLYYFCVFFGFVIFPLLKSYFGETPNETADPVWCSLFLNNFDRLRHGIPDSSNLSVLWSVAIEEQFYLVWPLFFLLIPVRLYHYIFYFAIAVSLIYRATHIVAFTERHSLGVISDMAVGGLAAYLSLNSRLFKNKIETVHPALNLIPYLIVGFLTLYRREIFTPPVLFVFKRLILSFFFAWIILEQNFSRSYFKLSRLRTITKLGKYTYGLYCLHPIAYLAVFIILERLGLNKYSWQLWLIELPLSLGLSILISYLSYTFYESKFLKLKDRFAYIVKS